MRKKTIVRKIRRKRPIRKKIKFPVAIHRNKGGNIVAPPHHCEYQKMSLTGLLWVDTGCCIANCNKSEYRDNTCGRRKEWLSMTDTQRIIELKRYGVIIAEDIKF